jgi:uncharacterized small protein (DUF1192 family)
MPDEFFTRAQPTPAVTPAPHRRTAPLRVALGLTLLAFIGGAVLLGYLVWGGKVHLPVRQSAAVAPAITSIAAAEQRVALLEQRLARIDAQAASTEATTGRAEALLIAAATRRAIERGAPLGYLAEPLKQHFGQTQPDAVAALIAANGTAATLDQLAQQLDAIAPKLTTASASPSGWDNFRQQVGALFVIHRDDAAAPRPEDRVERARALLRSGQIDAAATEVGRLSASPEARAWIAAARRHAATLRALDSIETAALQPPRPAAGPIAARPPVRQP